MGGGRLKLLAIDTSGPAVSCAVTLEGRVACLIAMNRALTHSETIMPAVDRALEAAGIACGDVDGFVAVAGPGSFTGVRIGVCAVKGLAHAVNRPCARVHALETLAMNFYGFDGLCCPILDARRGQVYCAAYDMKNGLPETVLIPEALPLSEYLARLPGDRRLMFVGDGVAMHGEAVLAALGGRAALAPGHLRDIRADAACALAEARGEWMAAAKLTPIYLRAPQAERERQAGRDHTKSLRRQREEEARR